MGTQKSYPDGLRVMEPVPDVRPASLPWITDLTALNLLADAVRNYRGHDDHINRDRMFAALQDADETVIRLWDEVC